MHTLRHLIVINVILTVAACGGGTEQQVERAEQAAKALENLTENPSASQPVDFRELQTVLPTLEGWEQAEPTGERMNAPIPFSAAEITYSRGQSTIDAKITDTALNQVLLAPYAAFLAAGYQRQAGAAYEKTTNFQGHPGWETFDDDADTGSVNLLVAKRFLVTIEGDGIEGTEPLYEVAQRMNLGKLASLK